jgi:4-amino-4-deoxy-L-arabinose transferase-like glycosyltransferase
MKRAAIALFALHTLRLALAPTFELAPQEAYYFLYAQHPALSYFDHPPAIAWLLMPFAALLGNNPIAPRLACWLATLGTGFAFAALARRTLSRARRPWALIVMGTTMLASVVALVATPDVPLLLFWTLALLLLHRAIFEGRRADWIAGGVLMGLAFDAKYTAVFLQLGLLLFLLIAPRKRHWLRTSWPYLSVLAAHAAMAPVYVWNATNGFASFLFQSAHRASGVGGLGVVNAGKLVATQAFLLLPPLLCAIVWALARALPAALHHRERRAREQLAFLACFALPAMALFAGLSLFSLVKPNWLMPTYLTATLLAVRLLRGGAVWKIQLGFALPLFALAALELSLYPVPVRSAPRRPRRAPRPIAPPSPSPTTSTRPPPSCASTRGCPPTPGISSASAPCSSTTSERIRARS